MSITEVEMWISSDELNVSAEEDVFEFVVAWIDHNKVDRKRYLFTLFRHGRLVYVSRDYLRTDIVTNELVMCDKDCLDLLEDIMKPNESENHGRHFLKPRKSLEVPVVVISVRGRENNISLCYFPREDAWRTRPCIMPTDCCILNMFTCHDQLYFKTVTYSTGDFNLLRYDTFSNTSTSLSLKYLSQLFVTSQNEIYTLVLQVLERGDTIQRRKIYSIMKHDHESNSWKHELSLDWTPRDEICIVNKDDVIYFLGGRVAGVRRCCVSRECLRDAYRYDIAAKKVDKIAEMKEARGGAHGAATYGKIFVIDGVQNRRFEDRAAKAVFSGEFRCEVYHETTDEWQVIAGLKIPHEFFDGRVLGMISVDGKLYALGEYNMKSASSHQKTLIAIECYDPDKNEWNKKTEFTDICVSQACCLKVCKGSEFLSKVSSPLKCHNPSQSENVQESGERLPGIKKIYSCDQ